MDVFSPEKRSQVMFRIRSKDTKPEKIIRSILHKLGFRFISKKFLSYQTEFKCNFLDLKKIKRLRNSKSEMCY